MSNISQNKAPVSVAIIMDGNGRWAKKRGLQRSAGHIEGAKNVSKVLTILREKGTRHVTLYAFSTENWKRPTDEVEGLMQLFERYAEEIVKKNSSDPLPFTVKFIGDKSIFSESLRQRLIEAERVTAGRDLIVNIALNYGGRAEIVNAANLAIADGHTALTEELLSRYMYTSDSPDPDLLIRTGGEMRISNFLLWQSAYSEIVVTDVLWPDFDREEIEKCLDAFYSRKRRFGGLNPDEETSEA